MAATSVTNPAQEPVIAVVEQTADGGSQDTERRSPSDLNENKQEFLSFSVKYGASILSVRLDECDTVADLKAILYSMTDVPPSSQKLLGLTRGKPPGDDQPVGKIQFLPSALKPRSSNKASSDQDIVLVKLHAAFMLVGTPEAERFQDPAQSRLFAEDLVSEQVEDTDYSQAPSQESSVEMPPADNPRNLRKLQKVIQRFSSFSVMNEPRPGKNLLVLDLDYTLADTKRLLDPSSPAMLSARPGLHEFLTAVWPHYDICVWSQTSWRWLEVKLIELGMIGHSDFTVSFVLDRTPMFSIKHANAKSHEVKPLALIWKRWPDIYGPHNTIHIDDLARNFAMNPNNGLRIKAYKNSPKFDTELQALKRYLLQLAHERVSDFSSLNHRDWKYFTGPEAGDNTENERRDS